MWAKQAKGGGSLRSQLLGKGASKKVALGGKNFFFPRSLVEAIPNRKRMLSGGGDRGCARTVQFLAKAQTFSLIAARSLLGLFFIFSSMLASKHSHSKRITQPIGGNNISITKKTLFS
jgi:hypothetical protein